MPSFRPSDRRPLTTNKPVFRISITSPYDAPITDVNLPTNDNVEGFTVTVEKPNGDDNPLNDGEVRFISFQLLIHFFLTFSNYEDNCQRNMLDFYVKIKV